MTEFEILPSGFEDIANGRVFYDAKEAGLGDYFMASVFAEIESLRLYAGIHRKVWAFTESSLRTFPMLCFTKSLREGACLSCPGSAQES